MWPLFSNVLVGVVAAFSVIMVHELIIEQNRLSTHRHLLVGIGDDLTRNNSLNTASEMCTTTTCTFVIMCGRGDTDTIDEMKPLIASSLVLSTCALKFILMTDKESAKLSQDLFNELETTAKPLTIEIWVISEKYVLDMAKEINYNVYAHHSGLWGTTKLFVPWILKDAGYQRVIVIDSDMLFIQDPRVLWVHVDKPESGDAWPWAYQMPLNNMSQSSTICSCIVVMNIPLILENDFYPTKFLNVLQSHPKIFDLNGTFSPPLGDQDLYYYLSKVYPGMFRSLPQRFNVDHCHDYYETLRNTSTDQVSLIHFNCGYLYQNSTKSGDKLFEFYRNYKWAWLKGYASVFHPIQVTTKNFP